jgi:hypothetical protein
VPLCLVAAFFLFAHRLCFARFDVGFPSRFLFNLALDCAALAARFFHRAFQRARIRESRLSLFPFAPAEPLQSDLYVPHVIGF